MSQSANIGMGVNLGTQALGGVMSLVQADKQAAARQEADKAARAAMEEAQRQMSQDFFSGLQLPMDAYERAMRETTAQQMQALSAMQEADPRALAGGVGRLQMASNDYLAKQREDLANRMFELDKLKASAAQGIAQNLGELEMKRAMGAQAASMAAEKARVSSMQQALGQFGSMGVSLDKALNPTYRTTDTMAPREPQVAAPQIGSVAPNAVQQSLQGQLAALNYYQTNPLTGNALPSFGWQGIPFLLPENR